MEWAKLFGCLRKPSITAPQPEAYFDLLYNSLDPEHLGRGFDIHTPDSYKDWPTAYALTASAQLARWRIDGAQVRLNDAVACSRWLLDNVGCASTQAPFWGVPYPRKIWEDQEHTIPGTAFCVPTCHSIQALCEIAEVSTAPPELRESARIASLKAATYYASRCFDGLDNSGLVFWYSPLERHSFHVTNATAMVTGQLQRTAQLSGADGVLSQTADRAVQTLLELRFAADASWGWHYFGKKIPSNKANRTNDLLHEAFVCHGLMDYKMNSGRLGGEYSYSELYEVLCRFYRDSAIHEFSAAEPVASRKKRLARVWAIGYALYVAARLEPALERPKPLALCELLFRQLVEQYFDGDDLLFRPGGEVVTQRVREVGHVLLGLAEYIGLRATRTAL